MTTMLPIWQFGSMQICWSLLHVDVALVLLAVFIIWMEWIIGDIDDLARFSLTSPWDNGLIGYEDESVLAIATLPAAEQILANNAWWWGKLRDVI